MIAEHETTGTADADGTCDPQRSDWPESELHERWQTKPPFPSDVHIHSNAIQCGCSLPRSYGSIILHMSASRSSISTCDLFNLSA